MLHVSAAYHWRSVWVNVEVVFGVIHAVETSGITAEPPDYSGYNASAV